MRDIDYACGIRNIRVSFLGYGLVEVALQPRIADLGESPIQYQAESHVFKQKGSNWLFLVYRWDTLFQIQIWLFCCYFFLSHSGHDLTISLRAPVSVGFFKGYGLLEFTIPDSVFLYGTVNYA